MTTHHTTESVERLAAMLEFGAKEPVEELRQNKELEAAEALRDLAAERDALRARLDEAKEILAWYRGNVSWCNNFGPEGTEARDNLAKDAGNRAGAFLNGGGNG